jgi:hypothetical protein
VPLGSLARRAVCERRFEAVLAKRGELDHNIDAAKNALAKGGSISIGACDGSGRRSNAAYLFAETRGHIFSATPPVVWHALKYLTSLLAAKVGGEQPASGRSRAKPVSKRLSAWFSVHLS